ncbi:MAG: M20/M25/M40 family metallo-hydrolase [Paracoccaceae bacterium]
MIDAALGHLGRLVAIPSVPGERNAQIVGYCEDVLARAGAVVRRVPSPLMDAEGLVASLRAGPGGLVLSGHLDVVPVEGQVWSGDPFAMRRVGDRLIGRGTTDMKGFVACALALAEAGAPIHLALSADEETTCRSVEALVPEVAARQPRGVIVGEPTGMRVMRAHPGSATYELRATGVPVHAARAREGRSAIALAAEVVAWTRTQDGPQWEPTVIAGGEMVNSVARTCRLTLDLRLPPGASAADADARLRDALRRIGGDALTASRVAAFPPLSAPDGPFVRACVAASAAPEAPPMPFGTEAGHFAAAGLPVVVMGPGELADAHLPDEGIAVAQLARCLEVTGRLASAKGWPARGQAAKPIR